MKEIIHAKIGTNEQRTFYLLEESDLKPEENFTTNENGEVIDVELVTPEFIPEPEPELEDGRGVVMVKRPAMSCVATVDGQWIEKIEVPLSLSRFQALTVLKLTKINETTNLYQATDAYIKSLDGDTADEIVIQTAWETASEFRRDSATILMAQKMFNLTDEQVDLMFIKGSEIKA